MCGLAGIISFKEKLNPILINKMTDIIRYRGPDDEGALLYNSENKKYKSFKRVKELNTTDFNGNILLGHRRLSIIDLSPAGHQPMSYYNNTLWIVFNGEIYNYIELREDLIKEGYKFNTNTDTEVILASYQHWGIDCTKKFNGMWSFCILDINNDVIFCSVDRAAIKPFYYFINEKYFCFASEIKQLYTLPSINKEFSLNIAETFGYLRADLTSNTIYKDISKLMGGENIIIRNFNCSSPDFKHYSWHKFDTVPNNYKISLDESSEKFKELFYDSVKLRMRSDVPLGTALSGGIDSSLIVLTINDILKNTKIREMQKTFTAGSEVEEYNEIPYAQKIIDITNTDAYFTTPRADNFINSLEQIYYHLETPYISSSCYAIWSVYKLVAENSVIVTLDGQGSDEILAGYDLYMYPYYQTDLLANGYLSDFNNNYESLRSYYGLSKWTYYKNILKINLKENQSIDSIYNNLRIINDKLISNDFKEFYSEKIQRNDDNNRASVKNIFSNNLNDYFYKTSLPTILNAVDKISMAHSIEARLPFLDYRLIEYVYSLPHNYKIRNGITKFIAKKAFEKELPIEIISRKKLGFVTAEKVWFKKEQKEIQSYILDNTKKLNSFFNKETILKNINKDINLNNNLIWNMLSIISLSKIFNISY